MFWRKHTYAFYKDAQDKRAVSKEACWGYWYQTMSVEKDLFKDLRKMFFKLCDVPLHQSSAQDLLTGFCILDGRRAALRCCQLRCVVRIMRTGYELYYFALSRHPWGMYPKLGADCATHFILMLKSGYLRHIFMHVSKLVARWVNRGWYRAYSWILFCARTRGIRNVTVFVFSCDQICKILILNFRCYLVCFFGGLLVVGPLAQGHGLVTRTIAVICLEVLATSWWKATSREFIKSTYLINAVSWKSSLCGAYAPIFWWKWCFSTAVFKSNWRHS